VAIDSFIGMGRKEDRLDGAEFRDLLDRTLRAADGDPKVGPLLRAAGLRMRFRFPDLEMVLNVSESDERGHHLRWKFSDSIDWEPKVDLTMDSEIANAFLQGKTSLAVAIARGQVRYRGEARVALLYLPAARLLVEPYRRAVEDTNPNLVVV
jgi:hypothetical protein